MAQPVITSNPKNTTNCIDSCSMLRVAAMGNGLTYQWQADKGNGFMNMSGASATNDTLIVCTDSAQTNIDYRCIVSDNNNNTVASNAATVVTDSCLAPIADFTYTFEQTNVCFTNTSKNATTVIWNFGDGKTDETNNNAPCNDYGVAWYYDVTIYAYNDYGMDQKTIAMDIVGLEELSNAFSIYPNPASDMLRVKSTQPLESIQLIDIKGQVVLSKSKVSNDEVIDISSLSTGVYTMLILSKEKSMFHKVVKQ